MTHASLFSGIGGFDLAAEWAGWTNLFHCEINEFCRKVLQYHFNESISYEDIKATDFREWRGQVDVLTGGFPCQPFSVAGKRKGADDDRYLWPEMLRAIREIQPAWVVGENVAGILTMVQPGEETEVGNQQTIFGEDDRKRTMLRQQFVVETVCCDLEREGYSVQPFVIPACAVGVPHRRDRVWFVANRTDTRTEGLQQGWEDGIYESRFSSDTDINRCGNRENEQKPFCGCEDKTNDSFGCQDESVAYSECDRRNEVDNEIQSEQPKRKGSYGNGYERDASDAKSKQSERYKLGERKDGMSEQRKFGRMYCENVVNTNGDGKEDRWKNFPTVSPVCRGNDGLPFNVDCLTLPFNKWRQESVKAYGNAIVPQVAYEIFKAINKYYQ